MRLIDADAIMEKVCGNCQGYDCKPDATDTVYGCELAEIINQMPTIEPEVRHGRWILCEDQYNVDNDNGNYAYYCSCCKHQDVHAESAKVSFCWNCGALMDGGAENG